MNTDRFKFRVWHNAEQRYLNPKEFVMDSQGKIIFIALSISDHKQKDITIEQCTGLKDKNGTLIFEGDVVCYDDTPYNGYATKKTGVVIYKKAAFCYKYSDCCGGLYQPLVPSDDFWQRKTEIIGNVHEYERKRK